MHMPTKPLKYSCFRISNVDDAKVIDWICIWSKLIFQPESNKHCIKSENQNKQRSVRRWNHQNKRKKTFFYLKENLKYVKITYNKREIKTIWNGDFWSKLILNHISLIDQGKEKLWRLEF